ncbi:MAG TPA: hypothetical protein VFR53_12930 [Methylomirabilota bacterium]|nr:hypothetical protein [Methylomirabilota bacterium]
MRLLSADEMRQLLPAETHAFRGPVPTQIVSSEEYFPTPQTAAHGFAPLGAADGPVKTAIFGENVARLYRYNRHAELAGPSRLAEIRAEYGRRGIGPSNRRYGYVVRG